MAKYKPGLIIYEAHNPQRSPTWRFDRARILADHRPRPLPCTKLNDDVWISKARTYLLAYAACASGLTEPDQIEERRRLLFCEFPALHNAHLLYLSDIGSKAEVYGHQRYAVEARLLAGQTNREIARRCHIIPGAIEYYEQLYFNVRDRLNARDYIIGQIITPPNGIGLQDFTLELSAKFFGYFGGPVVLEFVLNQFDTALTRPKSSKQLDGFFDAFFQKTIRRRAAEASITAEINRWNVMQLFEIHSMLIAETRLRERDMGNAGQYEENMRLLLNSVPWVTGRDSRKALGESPIGEYLKGPYELRAGEMAGFTNGPPSPTLLRTVTRPLQRQAQQEAKHDDEEAL
jgi:hypothetical protein